LILRDNFVLCQSGCESLGVTNAPSGQLTSVIVGDIGAAGTPTSLPLLNASDDGVYMVTGIVYVARTGQADGYHGAYPFMASRDIQLRSVVVGPSIISPAATNATLSFAQDQLVLTLEAFEYGFVVINEQVAVSPSVFGFNSEAFPGAAMMRRA
jgi:hypothetical protein